MMSSSEDIEIATYLPNCQRVSRTGDQKHCEVMAEQAYRLQNNLRRVERNHVHVVGALSRITYHFTKHFSWSLHRLGWIY